MKFGFAVALATAANAAEDWTSRPTLPAFALGFQSQMTYGYKPAATKSYSPSGFGSGKWNNFSTSRRPAQSQSRYSQPKITNIEGPQTQEEFYGQPTKEQIASQNNTDYRLENSAGDLSPAFGGQYMQQ